MDPLRPDVYDPRSHCYARSNHKSERVRFMFVRLSSSVCFELPSNPATRRTVTALHAKMNTERQTNKHKTVWYALRDFHLEISTSSTVSMDHTSIPMLLHSIAPPIIRLNKSKNSWLKQYRPKLAKSQIVKSCDIIVC